MTLTHGDFPLNQDIIGIMDDAVHDRLGDRALVLRGGIEPFIPLGRVVLSAEDRRAVYFVPRATLARRFSHTVTDEEPQSLFSSRQANYLKI